MGVTPSSVLDGFRQLTGPQKREALYVLAHELMAEENGESLVIRDPLGGEYPKQLLAKMLFGPAETIPWEDLDPETQQRAKEIMAGAKTVSFEEVIRDWLDPEKLAAG